MILYWPNMHHQSHDTVVSASGVVGIVASRNGQQFDPKSCHGWHTIFNVESRWRAVIEEVKQWRSPGAPQIQADLPHFSRSETSAIACLGILRLKETSWTQVNHINPTISR